MRPEPSVTAVQSHTAETSCARLGGGENGPTQQGRQASGAAAGGGARAPWPPPRLDPRQMQSVYGSRSRVWVRRQSEKKCKSPSQNPVIEVAQNNGGGTRPRFRSEVVIVIVCT